VTWALFRANFISGLPLSTHDELSLSVDANGADACTLCLNVTRDGAPAVRLCLVQNVATGSNITVRIGRAWYQSSSPFADVIKRWVPAKGHQVPAPASALSPCLLLPIGDFAIGLAKDIRHLVADVVEIDDRPVVGGGLPDFWQSNLARVIRACLRNPNIHFVIVIGAPENASNTLEWLRLNREQWSDRLYSVQRRLSIDSRHLEVFRDRGMVVESVSAAISTVLEALVDVHLRIPDIDFLNRPFIDLDAESRKRRLRLLRWLG